MAYILPELTYAYDALEPFMDAKTVEIHHDKHHATYTAKLNAALEKYPEFFNLDIVEILTDLSKVPEDVRGAVRNHGGGFYHHNFWWEQLGPQKGGAPSGKFADAINSKFGNFEAFKKELGDASIGVFGSGWGWLCKDAAGELVIVTTPNQDSPVSKGLIPILTIDVWEHAYYLKYQNRRPEFVENFWNLVDWEKINSRFLDR
jgi:superoxide dismutase, Fe-Mn family